MKETLSELIKSSVDSINNPLAKSYKKNYPWKIKRDNEYNISYIRGNIQFLKKWNNELKPYIKYLKNPVKDITEHTVFCAIYLLFSYNLKLWKSYFLLARNGQYSASMSIIRMIKEASKLIEHFALEYKGGEDKDLKRWFEGEIIPHSKGRESSSAFIGEGLGNNKMETERVKKLEAYIYGSESLPVHSSYVSILECINPMTSDVDFTLQTDLFRTKSSVDYAKGTMTTINTTLKFVYLLVLQNEKKYNELDDVLLKYDPSIGRA